MVISAHAQSQDAAIKFDVASVRPSRQDERQSSNVPLDNRNVYSTVSRDYAPEPDGGYFVARAQPMWRYIVFAYGLSGTQELALRFSYFSGLATKAPAWVTGGFDTSAARFDIEARADGYPTRDEMRAMMRSLLAERFKLAAHFEARQAPVFALVLAKPGRLGPKLQRHPAEDACVKPADAKAATYAAHVGELPVVCGVIAHVASSEPGIHFGARNITMALLASSLPTITGMATIPRPVVDETGLKGRFDFMLGGWALPAQEQAGEMSGPSFEEVLKEQLGLKLEPKKGPVEILVIDHIERPSEN